MNHETTGPWRFMRDFCYDSGGQFFALKFVFCIERCILACKGNFGEEWNGSVGNTVYENA